MTKSQLFTAAHAEARRTDYSAISRQIRDFGRCVTREEKARRAELYRQREAIAAFDGMSYRERFAVALRSAYAEARRAEKAAAVRGEGGFATERQISYLRSLGYTGTPEISKRSASSLIDQLKGRRGYSTARLTADDVDDFRTWVEGVGYVA